MGLPGQSAGNGGRADSTLSRRELFQRERDPRPIVTIRRMDSQSGFGVMHSPF